MSGLGFVFYLDVKKKTKEDKNKHTNNTKDKRKNHQSKSSTTKTSKTPKIGFHLLDRADRIIFRIVFRSYIVALIRRGGVFGQLSTTPARGKQSTSLGI